MKYSEQQIEAVTKELQRKFIAGQAKNYEVVVALVAMSEAGRITHNDIRNVLFKVFMGNAKGVRKALELASEIIDKDMIDAIVKEATQE